MSVFNEQLWWYLARSGGVVALVLAAASVIWGLLLSSRFLTGGPKPAWLLDLHKFLGGLTLAFTAIHMGALFADSFVQFSLADLLIPFRSTWKPAEVAAGVVAFWLLLAVQVSSSMMNRIPRQFWKWIHLASYPMLGLGLAHGITAGTDAGSLWYRLGSGGIIGLVTFLTAWRTWKVPARGRRSSAAPAATA